MKALDILIVVLILFAAASIAFAILKGNTIFPQGWFPSPLAGELFELVFVAWVLAEGYNNFVSARNQGGERKDKGSFWAVVVALYLVLGLSVLFKSDGIWAFIGAAQYAGVLLMATGIVIRQSAVLTLKGGFTVRVETKKGRKLTTEGLYGVVRHPSYTGTILTLVGFTIAIGTWAGALVALLLSAIAYSYRIRVEEQALLSAYGEEYRRYMKKTWRLFPGY